MALVRRPLTSFGIPLVALLVLVLLVYWRLPRTTPVLLPDQRTYNVPINNDLGPDKPEGSVELNLDNNDLPFPMVEATPLSEGPYTRELVIAKLAEQDTSWTDQLSDLIQPQGNLDLSIYVVNDKQAPLHTPANKGNEAMVYFTYILDRYDSLPDVSIFMHSHGSTWHNNDLLNATSGALVRYLNPDRVQREGYMNLRCHWHPGCRDWMHPSSKEVDINKQEQQVIAKAWAELFDDPVPDVLAAPCCSQFAVSRDRILRHPRSFYKKIQDWILNTDIPDHDSGRVFEYFWQYIFANELSLCPHPRICYCDGYGVCFDSDEGYTAYFQLQYRHKKLWEAVGTWREQRDAYEEAKQDGTDMESVSMVPPDPDIESRLLYRIGGLSSKMDKMKSFALGRGQDPAQRAVLVQLAINEIGDERDWFDVSNKEFPEES